MNQELKEIVFRLCRAEGTPGDETGARRAAEKEFAPYAETGTDVLGNLTAEMGNSDAETHILVDAHLDQIGLIVTGIEKNGFLRVDRCGGMDRRVMPGTAMAVYGKQKLTGVVCCTPPQFPDVREEKVPAISKMTVDVGCPCQTVKELVQPGDRAVFCAEPKELLGGRISAPALDDRSSVAALVRCAQLLSEKNLKCHVTFLCSTREEVGGQGAVTGAYLASPTQAIVVDVGFATQPGVRPQESGKLGGGPMIGFAPILNRSMSEKFVALAEKAGMPYHRDIMGGDTGTNSDAVAVTKGGVKTALLSIPERNMHTPAEVVDLQDIENTAQLIAEYIAEAE